MAAPTPFKLDVARSHGIQHTVLLDRRSFTSSYEELRSIAPDGFDAVIEATGAIGVLQHVLPLVRSGGILLVYGMAGEQQTIQVSPFEIFRREIQIRGSFAHAYGFARAIDFLRGGGVDPRGIITHRFTLEEYGQALEALRAPDCLKAVLHPRGAA
jgi:D-arabinitol dehydrogenase (NADP+)